MRVTLAITLGLIGLEIVRFLLFLVCRLFGYSIWIFPDLVIKRVWAAMLFRRFLPADLGGGR